MARRCRIPREIVLGDARLSLGDVPDGTNDLLPIVVF
jgi:hypothetical protein